MVHSGFVALLFLVPASLLLPGVSVTPVSGFGTAESPVLSDADRQVRELVAEATSRAPETDSAVVSGQGEAADGPFVVISKEMVAAWAPQLVLAIYAVPAALMLLMILFNLTELVRIRQSSDVVQSPVWLSALAQAQSDFRFREGAALLISEKVSSPISWGFIRPVIVIDPETVDASSDQAAGIISHELAHVIRGDWLKLLISRAAVAVFWFNPLVWQLARQAHQLREEATDDTVLMNGASRTGYAKLLVDAVRHDNTHGVAAAHGVAAGKNSLRQRVERVLDENARRQAMALPAGLAALVVMLLCAAPVAALTFQETAPTYPPLLANMPEIVEAPALRVTPPAPVLPDVSVRMEKKAPAMHALAHDPDIDQLVEAKIHGVTPTYAEEIAMAYPGLDNITLDALIEFRIHGVSADYLRGLQRAGFGTLGVDEIVEARVHGISAEFARQIADAGFPDLDFDDLLEFRIMGVTPDYIQSFRDIGYDDLDADDMIDMRAHGVDVRTLKKLSDQ
ncbi:M56 family metallopeptidase [Parvularcula sp. IMCC14364]|uniref:M56 family metallopeptidase n=1 Tax=Parvularcula sp. IMCC14364 TaxID=3067902 RepID=UPI0027422502|nr:M56 family metallopeptidase [Parvularcula sp. IMCC14364]